MVRTNRASAALAEWLPVQVLDPELHRLVDEGPGVRRAVRGLGRVSRGTWLSGPVATLPAVAPPAKCCVEGQVLPGPVRMERTARVRRGDPGRAASELSGGSDPRMFNISAMRAAGCGDSTGVPGGLAGRQDIGTGPGRQPGSGSSFGATHAGPHRADIQIDVAKRRARGRVSRGQQKLLAASLVLGQLQNLQGRTGARAYCCWTILRRSWTRTA